MIIREDIYVIRCIRNKLKERREFFELSIEDLSLNSGISERKLVQLELGTCSLSDRMITKVCKALDLDGELVIKLKEELDLEGLNDYFNSEDRSCLKALVKDDLFVESN